VVCCFATLSLTRLGDSREIPCAVQALSPAALELRIGALSLGTFWAACPKLSVGEWDFCLASGSVSIWFWGHGGPNTF
jgi:hypothetical protein